ncbi:MAG: phosphate ABC transporter permease subunit PstC [Bacteriovoracaceae bacterium]|nr:phosphate ABC transporter permease subunit PstC [Bacteriovoracaceae bacterium]
MAELILALSALVTIFIALGIFLSLSKDTYEFFRLVSFKEFFLGTRWEPLLEPRSFGVLPLICGTFLIVVGSALFAIPVGMASAIYLSEYASDKTRRIIKPTLEILAGIPSVVYGYFALTFITPLIKIIFPQTQTFNALSASLVVGIMILPMVASLCDDAFKAVSPSLRQGGYAMGATSLEVITSIVLPASWSRIVSAFVLAASRAIGETMAVTLAAGATPKLTLNPLESIQTMTAYIVQVSLGDTPAGGIEFKTSIAVGMLLFIITFLLNLLARKNFKKVNSL